MVPPGPEYTGKMRKGLIRDYPQMSDDIPNCRIGSRLVY
jgi:hypothetical protein